MNLPSLVVVVLRLVSLNFLLQVVVQLVLKLTSILNASQRLPSEEFGSLMITPLLLILGLIVGAVLLWVFAPAIARFITHGLPTELSFGALSLSDCYSLVFMGLGLFYAAGYFPRVLNWMYYLLKMEASRPDDAWRQQMSWYDVSQTFLSFLVGVVLFVNGRKWAVALAGKQKEGAPVSTPVDPEPPANI